MKFKVGDRVTNRIFAGLTFVVVGIGPYEKGDEYVAEDVGVRGTCPTDAKPDYLLRVFGAGCCLVWGWGKDMELIESEVIVE